MSMTFTEHEPPMTTLVGGSQFTLETFDRTATVEQLVESIKRNGAVKCRGFLTKDEVDALNARVRPVLDKAQYNSPTDPTKRLGRLPEHAPEMTTKLLTDELYLGVMDAFLSIKNTSWVGMKRFETTERPIVAMSSIFEVGPGMPAQDLHRDDAIWYNNRPRITSEEYGIGRDTSISFFIAGNDTRVENGATMFVPGSHLGQSDEQPNPKAVISAELDAGDAFFMLSSCYHGAGQNSTQDYKRLVYALFMQQPQLRQEENFALFLPHDLVRSFPMDVQRRLGYDVALPNLGWVDHASPLESVLKQKGADRRNIPGYNPVDGVAENR